MKTMTHPIRTLLAALGLSLGASGVALAQDIEISSSPIWTPGGHYTAELDLGGAELTLLPLAGIDRSLPLARACAPGRAVDDGVYVLTGHGRQLALQRTHPEGQVEALDSEHVPLAACEDLGVASNALRLPQLALEALEQSAVGAIYVHR